MTQTLVLRHYNRAVAHVLVNGAPDGSVMRIDAPKRTLDQNAKFHAMLSDISRAKPEGRVLAPEIWKCLFMASVGHQCTFEPSLDGNGVVPIGFKSSRLSKPEFSDLIEAAYAYGAQHGVVWSEKE